MEGIPIEIQDEIMKKCDLKTQINLSNTCQTLRNRYVHINQFRQVIKNVSDEFEEFLMYLKMMIDKLRMKDVENISIHNRQNPKINIKIRRNIVETSAVVRTRLMNFKHPFACEKEYFTEQQRNDICLERRLCGLVKEERKNRTYSTYLYEVGTIREMDVAMVIRSWASDRVAKSNLHGVVKSRDDLCEIIQSLFRSMVRKQFEKSFLLHVSLRINDFHTVHFVSPFSIQYKHFYEKVCKKKDKFHYVKYYDEEKSF